MTRRLPTEAQAKLAAERAADIRAALRARGEPLPRVMHIGPVMLEFGPEPADDAPTAESREAGEWQGRPFG